MYNELNRLKKEEKKITSSKEEKTQRNKKLPKPLENIRHPIVYRPFVLEISKCHWLTYLPTGARDYYASKNSLSDTKKVQTQYTIPYRGRDTNTLSNIQYQTLPEAQRTQGIDSIS